MSNEVHKLFDDLFIKFIEDHQLQVWPDRGQGVNRKTVVIGWVVQCPKPFYQVAHENLYGALTKMAFKLGDLRFKEQP